MKKGISLIVLVITIIVMIIIAGAIIISLNSSNVIQQSDYAVQQSNKANAQALLNLKYAEILAEHYKEDPTITYVPNDKDLATLAKYVEDLTDTNEGYTVSYLNDASGKHLGYQVVDKAGTTPDAN